MTGASLLWGLTLLAFDLQCGAAFQEEDIIVLNGTKEDVEMLKKRMEERRLKAKLEKVMKGSASAPSPAANYPAASAGAAPGTRPVPVVSAMEAWPLETDPGLALGSLPDKWVVSGSRHNGIGKIVKWWIKHLCVI